MLPARREVLPGPEGRARWGCSGDESGCRWVHGADPRAQSARAQPLPPRKSSAFAFLSLELRVSRGPPSGNSNKGDDAAHACHAFDLLGPGVVVARRGLSSQLRPQGERQTPERRGGRPEGCRGAEEGPGTRSWGAGSPGSGGERVWGGRSCRTRSPAASAPRPAAELSRSSSVGSPSGSLAPRAFGHRLQQGLAGEQPLPRISALLSTQWLLRRGGGWVSGEWPDLTHGLEQPPLAVAGPATCWGTWRRGLPCHPGVTAPAPLTLPWP